MTGGARVAALGLALFAAVPAPAAAQSALALPLVQATQLNKGANAFNWYYATAFGTGIYRAGNVDVIALTLPFAFTLRPSTPDQWGLRLLLPVTVGGADLNDRSGLNGVPDKLASVAVVPGIELDIQARPDWTLSPYVSLGRGQEFLEGTSATILVTGIKSRYRFDVLGHPAYLGNGLVYSRTWSSANDDSLGLFIAGFNMSAFDGPEIGGHATKVWGHLIYYGFFNNLEFVLPGSEVVALRNEYEVAASLVPRKPWNVLGFELDTVGLGYRFSTDTRGVTLFTSFPF